MLFTDSGYCAFIEVELAEMYVRTYIYGAQGHQFHVMGWGGRA